MLRLGDRFFSNLGLVAGLELLFEFVNFLEDLALVLESFAVVDDCVTGVSACG